MATNWLIDKAVTLADSPEWTAKRAAWVLRATSGATVRDAEAALDEIDLDATSGKPDRVMVRAADTLALLVIDLRRATPRIVLPV